MKILDNGVLREMTDDELQQCAAAEENAGGEDALTEFFAGLASGETNSIAKIRALAREFLNKTGG